MRRIGVWAARLVQQGVDRAAARMHARVLADPDAGGWAPETVLAVACAVLVLAGFGCTVAGLAWATAHAQGFLGWVFVVIGWVVLLALIPHPGRLPEETVVLDPAAYPSVHRLVGELADAVGAPRPQVLAVDTQFNAYVTRVGWRARRTLVVGLPLWVALDRPQRLGLIGHELGHLASADTVLGRLLGMAGGVLARFVAVLWQPVSGYAQMRDALAVGGDVSVSMAERFSRFVMRLLALPFLVALVVFSRLAATHGQDREYRADRQAALALGSAGLAGVLACDAKGLHTVASAAAGGGRIPSGRSPGVLRSPGIWRRRSPRATSCAGTPRTHPPGCASSCSGAIRSAWVAGCRILPSPVRPRRSSSGRRHDSRGRSGTTCSTGGSPDHGRKAGSGSRRRSADQRRHRLDRVLVIHPGQLEQVDDERAQLREQHR